MGANAVKQDCLRGALILWQSTHHGVEAAPQSTVIGKGNPRDYQSVTRFLLLALDLVRGMADALRLVLAAVGRMC